MHASLVYVDSDRHPKAANILQIRNLDDKDENSSKICNYIYILYYYYMYILFKKVFIINIYFTSWTGDQRTVADSGAM